jgi:hypothetical protein
METDRNRNTDTTQGVGLKMTKLIMVIFCIFLSGCWIKGEGQKVGVLVKVSKEGAIWGTWEGELIRGGLQDASGANGGVFHFGFGAFKTKMVEKALELMEKNKPVTLIYECEVFVGPWRGESNCFVKNIIEHGK